MTFWVASPAQPGRPYFLGTSRADGLDRPTLERVVSLYREGGWPAEVEGDAFTAPFSAPSAGPPPWHLYLFAFHTAFGVATAAPYGATRWRFER